MGNRTGSSPVDRTKKIPSDDSGGIFYVALGLRHDLLSTYIFINLIPYCKLQQAYQYGGLTT